MISVLKLIEFLFYSHNNPVRLILLLHRSQSWQEADGPLQGVTEVKAMEGIFTEVWTGLKETNRGW